MSLSAILLGLINIAIVVVILLLIGACILWFHGLDVVPGACQRAKALYGCRRPDSPLHAGGLAARHSECQDYRRASEPGAADQRDDTGAARHHGGQSMTITNFAHRDLCGSWKLRLSVCVRR